MLLQGHDAMLYQNRPRCPVHARLRTIDFCEATGNIAVAT